MESVPAAFPDQFRNAAIGGRQFRIVSVEGLDGAQLGLAVPASSNPEPLLEALQIPEYPEDMTGTVERLRRVGVALPAAGLPGAFNYMYWHLSRGVNYSIQQSPRKATSAYPSFAMPGKVEKTAGIFAEEYFAQARILAEGMAGDDAALLKALNTMNLPWLLTMLHPMVHESSTDGTQAMAGMTSHIDYDLQEALRKSGIDPEYYPDYTKIMNKLFQMTKHDLAPVLVPGAIPNSLKRIVAAPALAHIATRRVIAWDRSHDLVEAATPLDGEIVPAGTMPERYVKLRAEHEDDAVRRIGRIYRVGSGITRLVPGTGSMEQAVEARLYQPTV